MRVAITFCNQTEHERRKNENGYSFFCGCEAESLAQLIEFETPALFDHDLEVQPEHNST
jgi:hypothetical protein